MNNSCESNKDLSLFGRDPLVRLIREQECFKVGVSRIGVVENSSDVAGVVERLERLTRDVKVGLRSVTKLQILDEGTSYEVFYFMNEEVRNE